MISRLVNKRGQQGFTLMELLIVMAIIGILTSTAALVYRHSVTKAREAALTNPALDPCVGAKLQ